MSEVNVPDALEIKLRRADTIVRLVGGVVLLVACVVMLRATVAEARLRRRAYGSHDDCPNKD